MSCCSSLGGWLGQGFSVVLPEKLQTGKWNVYRSARSPLKLVTRFPDHPEIATLHDNFEHAVQTFQDYKYLGSRIRIDGTVGEYKWMTYGEAGTARTAIGSGLHYYGLQPGARVGLYFINRPEWMIVDHACSAYSYTSVPLYDTLGPDAVKYIVNHADVQAIFCVPTTLNTLLTFLSEIPSVRLIVVVGGIDEHLPSLPSTTGMKLLSYTRLLSQGRSSMQPFCPPRPEDIATICYTSGTTGTPKGVVLSHANLIASVAGMTLAVKFYPSDIYISYLPLAHIYERANQITSAYYGVAVGFYQGDNLKLMDDLVTLRPTIFSSVPRLFNRIYAGITNAVQTSGVLKQRLFNAAYNSKKQAVMNAMEGLNSMMKVATQNSWLQGFRIDNNPGTEMQISHLLYADDTVIFCDAKEDEIRIIRMILVIFEAVSGLKVNWRKSSMFSIKEVPHIQHLANILGCKIEKFPTTYLGMPLGRTHKDPGIWNDIVEKTEKRLASWKSQYLSLGGRSILINSVLDSLPTYIMSLFPMPPRVEARLDKIRRDFLWCGTRKAKECIW